MTEILIFSMVEICRGGKNLVSSCPGVAFATPCHPMATGLYEVQLEAGLNSTYRLGVGNNLSNPLRFPLNCIVLLCLSHTVVISSVVLVPL